MWKEVDSGIAIDTYAGRWVSDVAMMRIG